MTKLGCLWQLVSASVVVMAGVATTASFAAEPAEKTGFRFAAVNDTSLGLWEGKRPVLVYNHGVQKPTGVPENRYRSTYVHPIYGLDGEVLTDDFPKDHYHHRGLFWGWPHIRIGDKEYNLWALQGIRHQFEKWTEQKAEASQAILGIANGWYVEDRAVVREEIRLVVHPAKGDERALDVECRWTALKEPVTLWGAEGKSYGGMNIRFAPRQETVITTADGRQPKDLNLTRLGWADLTAQFKGAPGPSGIALFLDRSHPDYPPTWVTRHYGFLGVGWPGIKPFELKPGKTVTCKYRVWIHRGPADVQRLEQAYRNYTK